MKAHSIVEIVKVQLPLAGDGPAGHGLVYAQGHTRYGVQVLPPRVVALLLTRHLRKGHFEAVWLNNAWQIGALTTDQQW